MTVLLREALGDSLRRVRTDQGRTLREVSTDARVSLGYLSEVERGQKEASSELLAAICDALDVEIADLLLDVGHALRPITTGPVEPALAAATVDAELSEVTDDQVVAGEPTVAAEHLDAVITAAKVVIPAPAGRATALAAA
ncbi:helix-turn-helix domain-containing protein [Gordonia soli]|uniref:Putative Xre family DNA-binding protein n=1 Tax=Gordonia soli NBRC 108243 TaxID=1223545 RepID=M0QS51_9ACTN|nr:helix-turn-helix transcriptional regulator [Gordonia soli]GAC70837.1 putative Xre family DNA-binding protein [Gordonia soli NBRC 108243]